MLFAIALVAAMPQPSAAVRADPPYFLHHQCTTVEVVVGSTVLLLAILAPNPATATATVEATAKRVPNTINELDALQGLSNQYHRTCAATRKQML